MKPVSGSVGFDAIRQRLERAEEATRRWLSPDADTSRRILDQRARDLARRHDEGTVTGETVELLLFRANGEAFAVDLRWVLAVARAVSIEPIPGAPPVFRGLVNHRGKVLPAVDLGTLLNGAPTSGAASAAATNLLVLGDKRPELGISIEDADEVSRVSLATIDRTTTPAWIERAALSRGMLEGRRVVLDGRLLLDDPRLTFSRSVP
jgi:purine-binding chemotaxis protein CheW